MKLCDFITMSTPAQKIDFKDDSARTDVIDASTIFTTQGLCSLASCLLKKPGCASAYDGNNMSVLGTVIKGNQNVQSGWSESVCLECTDSKGGTLNKDQLAISQSAKPKDANDCPAPLSSKKLIKENWSCGDGAKL